MMREDGATSPQAPIAGSQGDLERCTIRMENQYCVGILPTWVFSFRRLKFLRHRPGGVIFVVFVPPYGGNIRYVIYNDLFLN